jgi:hypothetical protein
MAWRVTKPNISDNKIIIDRFCPVSWTHLGLKPQRELINKESFRPIKRPEAFLALELSLLLAVSLSLKINSEAI